jgi:hypothetical protein
VGKMPEQIVKCKKCGNEYLKRRLRCEKCNEIGVNRLYKYVPFSINSVSILIRKKIWIPKASTLNDPFEFYFNTKKMDYRGMMIDESEMELATRQMKEMGVFSLSDINNDILMWSHYSDEHKGFCIEFERIDDNYLGNYDNCIPVLYEDNIPNYYPEQLEEKGIVANILTTKSKKWNYENEWRLLTETGNIEVDLPGKMKGIVFGQRMTNQNKETINAILGSDVNYYEAVKDKNKYALLINRI